MMQCCGIPAEWAGRKESARQIWLDIEGKWQRMGCPIVIIACPGCYSVFKKHLPMIKLRYIAEILLDLPVLPDRAIGGSG